MELVSSNIGLEERGKEGMLRGITVGQEKQVQKQQEAMWEGNKDTVYRIPVWTAYVLPVLLIAMHNRLVSIGLSTVTSHLCASNKITDVF